MDSTKSKANEFLTKYSIDRGGASLSKIKNALKSMNFKVVRFSHGRNSDNVLKLLENINMTDFAEDKESFYYNDDFKKIIFALENLPDDDLLVLLVHEIGHIYCDNTILRDMASDTNIQREKAANDFMHYVLDIRQPPNIPLIAGIIIAVLFIIWAVTYKPQSIPDIEIHNTVEYGLGITSASTNAPAATSVPSSTLATDPTPNHAEALVYVTKSGKKYHSLSCWHISGKETTELTVDDAQNIGYEPCKDCNP